MTFRQPRAQPAPAHGGEAVSGPRASICRPASANPRARQPARTARSQPQKNSGCLKSSEQPRSLKNSSPATSRAVPIRVTRAPKEKASDGRGHDSVRLAFFPAARGTPPLPPPLRPAHADFVREGPPRRAAPPRPVPARPCRDRLPQHPSLRRRCPRRPSP